MASAQQLSDISRYIPGNDGKAFRAQTFRLLADRYRDPISAATRILADLDFEFSSIAEAHRQQLREELIFRHALPFCVTEETYFSLGPRSARCLASLLAGHTLALTHLDYHLDGASPSGHAVATAVKMDSATAVAYSVRMIYAACRLSADLGSAANALFRDVFDPISGFVTLRMHEDWLERYDRDLINGTDKHLTQYLHSTNSRLLGSGYWEVMVRGSFSSRNAHAPQPLLKVIHELRRLRQLVDELADFAEDVQAGLVTTPLLFALQQTDDADVIKKCISILWDVEQAGSGQPHDTAIYLKQLVEYVAEARGFDQVYELADHTWQEAVDIANKTLGDAAPGYLALLDLKRAKLEQLKCAGWSNEDSPKFFRVA